jgi:hypothetical protein
LVYTYPVRIEDAGGSFLRVRKFLSRGYNIQSESLAGVTARLCLGVDEIRETMKRIVRGSDAEYWLSKLLQSLMLEVDPLVIGMDGDAVEGDAVEGNMLEDEPAVIPFYTSDLPMGEDKEAT